MLPQTGEEALDGHNYFIPKKKKEVQQDDPVELLKEFLTGMPEITVDREHTEMTYKDSEGNITGHVLDNYETVHDYILESFANWLIQNSEE